MESREVSSAKILDFLLKYPPPTPPLSDKTKEECNLNSMYQHTLTKYKKCDNTNSVECNSNSMSKHTHTEYRECYNTNSVAANLVNLGADAAVNAASGDARRTSSTTSKDTNRASGACEVGSSVHVSNHNFVDTYNLNSETQSHNSARSTQSAQSDSRHHPVVPSESACSVEHRVPPIIDYEHIVSSIVDRLRPNLEVSDRSSRRKHRSSRGRMYDSDKIESEFCSSGTHTSEDYSSASSRFSHRSSSESRSRSSGSFSSWSSSRPNSIPRDADYSESSSSSIHSRSRSRSHNRSSSIPGLSATKLAILQQHGFTKSDIAARVNHISSGTQASALHSMPSSQFLISVSPDCVKQFSGNIEDYEQFRSEFMAFAETLPEHQWLHNLRDKLPSGAKNLISRCHGISRDSFDQAIQILDSNYDKVEAIVQVLIAQIDDLLNPVLISDNVKFAIMVAEVRGKLDRIFHLDPVQALALNGCLPKMMSCLPTKPYEAACLIRLNKPKKYNFSTVLRLAEDHVKLVDSQRVGPENRDIIDHCDSFTDELDLNQTSDSCSLPSKRHLIPASSESVVMEGNSEASILKASSSDKDSAFRSRQLDKSNTRTASRSRSSHSKSRSLQFKCNLCGVDDHDIRNCSAPFTSSELKFIVSDKFLCLACGGLNHKSSKCTVVALCPNADFLCSNADSKCKNIPHCKRLCSVVKENF